MGLETCLYFRECLGKDGIPIQIYKFRTMQPNANEKLDEILNEQFDSYGKPINDQRVTAFGRFLRKYWIDELPQLYNLAQGDIKLVGVRPMKSNEWERYPYDIRQRALRQKPGLMGVQYAHLRTESFEDHLKHLREYLDEWEENPNTTDLKYLQRIMLNILLKDVRSS